MPEIAFQEFSLRKFKIESNKLLKVKKDMSGKRYLSVLVYGILIAAAYLSFGAVLVHSGNEILDNSTQGTAFVKQMA